MKVYLWGSPAENRKEVSTYWNTVDWSRLKYSILTLFVFVLFVPLHAQYLNPDQTVKISTPAEVPVAPQTVSKPAPVPSETKPPVIVALPPADETYFTDFAAYSRERNIILVWHLVAGRGMNRRIQIYRFVDEPRVIHDISKGTLIAKLSADINLFEDVPPEKGAYYYAIFVETGQGLNPMGFLSARNLVGPIMFQTARQPEAPSPALSSEKQSAYKNNSTPTMEQFESEEIDEEDSPPPKRKHTHESPRAINSVIRRTFLQGDYPGAFKALQPFLRSTTAQVRAKAVFYMGLSLYRMGEYDRALKYFSHPLTKKYYRTNAEFWIKKTNENLR